MSATSSPLHSLIITGLGAQGCPPEPKQPSPDILHRPASTGFDRAMALIVYLLLHISAQALHYIRLILALVFLPRLPLRHFHYGQSFTAEITLNPGSQHRSLISPMTSFPHARKESKQPVFSGHHGYNVFCIYAVQYSAATPSKPQGLTVILIGCFVTQAEQG